jgi:hypothetical protein
MKLSTRVSDYFEPMGLVFNKELDKDHYMNYTLDAKKTPRDVIKKLKEMYK